MDILDYYIKCPALNGNKIGHYIPSTRKYIGEINMYLNIGSHKASYVLS